jgi:hypothetical protein
MVKAGPKGTITAAPASVEPPKAGRARVAASIEGFITTPTDTGPERLKLRPRKREMINGLFDTPPIA